MDTNIDCVFMIIGLGSMGRRRTRILKSLLPDARIVGVDGREDRRTQWSSEYQSRTYKTIEAVVKEYEIEAAFVCTSPESHHVVIRECLEKDFHVFSEINLVSDGYMENMQLAKDKGLVLFLSSTPMYKQEMRAVKEMIIKQEKPVFYRYHVGQYLPDWHPWETFKEFFVGNRRTNGCREIFAIEMPWLLDIFGDITEYHVMAGNTTGLDIDFSDSYLLQVKHVNGCCGSIAFDVTCRQAVRRLEAYNEELYLEWLGKPENLAVKNLQTEEMEYPCREKQYQVMEGYNELINEQGYVDEVINFLNVLSGRENSRYSFEKDCWLLEFLDKLGV